MPHPMSESWLNWRPMSEAPKDGTPVFLRLKPELTKNATLGWVPERFGFKNGFVFVGYNLGTSSQWMFAAPVGCGGFTDSDFAAFAEIPA